MTSSNCPECDRPFPSHKFRCCTGGHDQLEVPVTVDANGQMVVPPEYQGMLQSLQDAVDGKTDYHELIDPDEAAE